MHRPRYRYRPEAAIIGTCCCLIAVPAFGEFPTYTNESSSRLAADAGVGLADPDEVDYAWDDIDQDGDIDLVVARKQPVTSPGGRRNVLFMNNNGVLTDETALWIPAFLDLTNDRDAILTDVDGDGWLDIVTAAACNGCNLGTPAAESRLYMNLGDGGDGTWDGYGGATVLFNGNNFCSVAAGDIDGINGPDLYFLSYNDTTEDQLIINQGDGTFVNGNNRLTTAMRDSNFGSHVELLDMDLDGDLDVVKSQNGPVEIFRNDGTGFFDLLDNTYGGAAYHFGAGDLTGDGLLDIVIADDGIDRQINNNGNIINGAADTAFTLPNATNGFGGNIVITDLDDDGDNDVIITDVDVDLAGCDRINDILENTGGGNLVVNSANIPDSQRSGTHDVAVFDLDGDTFVDIIFGRCQSTQVWINSPPISIEYTYPNGLPSFLPPNESTTFDVELEGLGDGVDPGTEQIFTSINGGPFTAAPLSPIGGGMYEAVLPGVDCTQQVSFYLSAETTGGLTFTDPPAAPGQSYDSTAAEGTEMLFEDTFEVVNNDWTIVNDASLTSGAFEQVDPNIALSNNVVAQPDDDATPDGVMAFITENGPPGDNAANQDVDGGPTMIISPVFDLSGNDGLVSYSRWAFSEFGVHDALNVYVSNDAGANWVLAELVADTNSAWASTSWFVSEFVEPTDQVQFRFQICDCPNDSVTEAGVDDFRLDILNCGPGKDPCPWDLDGSGGVDTVDFLDLLSQWGTDPGGAPDFNGDNIVDTLDFLDLLANWGACP